jgi:hypothetical protein
MAVEVHGHFMLNLDQNRTALVQVDADLVAAEQRLARQLARIDRLRMKGQDTVQAEALLAGLEQTLTGWQVRRALLLAEIVRQEDAATPYLPHSADWS